MQKRWCLLKESDGNRGLDGKKKVYNVHLDGKTVRFEWGMAEKDARQTKTQVFASAQEANFFALAQVSKKLHDRGYELVYAV